MENHPIPQNITGYQFKLIGNMTVKQFIYLALGAAIAFILYFFVPIPHTVSIIIGFITVSIGVFFAFVQIDGRPFDTMLINFIRALFSPTKYVYEKDGGNISNTNTMQTAAPQQAQSTAPPPQPQPQPQIVVTPPPAPIPTPMPVTPIGPVIEIQTQAPIVPPPPTAQDGNEKAIEDAEKIIENEKKLEEKEEELKKELEEAKAESAASQAQNQPNPNQKSAEELEKILMETIAQKEAMEKEFLILKAKLESSQTEKFKPSSAPEPLKESSTAREIPKGMESSVGIPGVNDVPNLIKGIVKDPRGNPLANILVEVKDAEDNPVRAFKTSGLGQFASATAVSNGKYTLVFEDPKDENKFDVIEIEAKGEFIPPLEIISIDKREELRRELFN